MCKDILRNRDDRREEDQTLAGGVLFFFGSLSIVGVGFVKIPPQFYDKGTFHVWF